MRKAIPVAMRIGINRNGMHEVWRSGGKQIVREDGYDHPSTRYRAMVFSDSPDERAAIESQVNATLAATFGDTPSLATGGYIVGGLGWITSNDMPYDKRTPQDHPAWRQRIEKARREITDHQREWRVRIQAESLTRHEIANDIQEIRRWANSLKERQ
jgi:hypothetical protein